MYVDPLVEEVVSTPQDVVDLLEKGNVGRKVGATDWVREALSERLIGLTIFRTSVVRDHMWCLLL